MDKRSSKGTPDGKGSAGGKNGKPAKPGDRPGWANGLRQLYDSVVEEPLPDSFSDLLAKLDRKN